jgi:hypothetical protein
MMRIAVVLMALLAAGCALIPTYGLEPGKSTRAEVTARMGAPAMTIGRPDGAQQLYFTHWPWGRLTYVATIGSDGVLRDLDQRLTYPNIHKVRPEMTRDEVRTLLGPPYEVSRLPRQKRDVWDYRWRFAREGRVLFVQFSDDGIVREVIERHDDDWDPESDPFR